MKNYLAKTESFLENLDSYRDKFLFLFIKPYWPKAITPNHITYVRVAVGGWSLRLETTGVVLLVMPRPEGRTCPGTYKTFGDTSPGI